MKKLLYIFGLVIILTLISHRALTAEREDDDERETPTNNTRTINANRNVDDAEQDTENPAPTPAPVIAPVVEPPPAPTATIQKSAPISPPSGSTTIAPVTTVQPITSGAPAVNTNQPVLPPEAAPAPATPAPFPWAWAVTRAAGIASYILLAVLSLLGILLTTGLLYRLLSPATAWSLHRAVASVLLLSVVAHIAGLLLDPFIKLRIIDVLIPFVSPYQPLLVGLGILGFYLLLLIIFTSLYTMTSHARFWRTIHAFGFIMFALIFLHGVLIGTDSKQVWMQAIYWVFGVLVAGAGAYRLIWRFRRIRDTSGQV